MSLKRSDKKHMLEKISEFIAPGKPLRRAIDRIQEASLGALIVLSDPLSLEDLVEGGFVLETEFSPQKVYELAKMDGAVIISEDCKIIHGANMHVQPNPNIETDESGTRHRTADRLAKQIDKTVITVSERRNKITVFSDDVKYILETIGDLLIKCSQAVSSLEKYSNVINKYLSNLNYYELENIVTLEEAISGIRLYALLFAMDQEVLDCIKELGEEGRIIKLQRDEIMINQKIDCLDFIKDYCNYKNEKLDTPEVIFDKVLLLTKEEITEGNKLANLLGYDMRKHVLDDIVSPKGYRLLNSISKLSISDVESIISVFSDFESLMNATFEEINEIKGIVKYKAERIVRTRDRYKNLVELER